MDCPKCGTYNPEEREKCWRCDEPLPKPEPKKKKNPQKSAQTMLYVLIAAFTVFTLLRMCGLTVPGLEAPAGGEPTGFLSSPTVLVEMMSSRLALL